MNLLVDGWLKNTIIAVFEREEITMRLLFTVKLKSLKTMSLGIVKRPRATLALMTKMHYSM